MSITFFDKEAALEYKKDKAFQGDDVEIIKSGNRYLANIKGKIDWKDRKSMMEMPQSLIDYKFESEIKEEPDTHTYNETSINDINKLIKERTTYGTRTIVTEKPGFVVSWSNSSGGYWYNDYYQTKKGTTLTLDANQIFVPNIKKKELKELIDSGNLINLPLFGGSYEQRVKGKSSFIGNEIPPPLKIVHDNPEYREKSEPLLKKAFDEKDEEN